MAAMAAALAPGRRTNLDEHLASEIFPEPKSRDEWFPEVSKFFFNGPLTATSLLSEQDSFESAMLEFKLKAHDTVAISFALIDQCWKGSNALMHLPDPPRSHGPIDEAIRASRISGISGMHSFAKSIIAMYLKQIREVRKQLLEEIQLLQQTEATKRARVLWTRCPNIRFFEVPPPHVLDLVFRSPGPATLTDDATQPMIEATVVEDSSLGSDSDIAPGPAMPAMRSFRSSSAPY